MRYSDEEYRGADFKDKNVLVLGSSNTAMDCAVDLCGHAKKIYLSHRHGGVIVRPSVHDRVSMC